MAGGRPLGNRRAKRRRITRPIDSSCPGLFHETHLEVVVVASTLVSPRPSELLFFVGTNLPLAASGLYCGNHSTCLLFSHIFSASSTMGP